MSFPGIRITLFLKFRETFAKSPVKILGELRMRRAQQLLTQTDMSVKEVALAVGYTNPLYFSRQFRRDYGVSPVAYRKQRAAQAGGPRHVKPRR